MPRHARTVIAGFPHHVTHRGNRREQVFFNDDDRLAYLYWLELHCVKQGVDVLAYCLMPNHVHVVAVPATGESLHRALKPLHMRYAQRINRVRDWTGHLWQGRYYSSVLDNDYLLAAVRYVERNPVRARMVERAESYPWSSAAAHCGLKADRVLARESPWSRALESIRDWPAFLAGDEDPSRLDLLRRNADMGLPCGSDEFIQQLEASTGRNLHFRPQGRNKGDATLYGEKGSVPFIP